MRRLPNGLHAEATVGGVRRQLVTFHFWDRAYVALNTETREVRLQWKARELWSKPQLVALRDWLVDVSDWFGVELEGPDQLARAFELGWTMTGLEVCADAVGLAWTAGDEARFLGRYTRERKRELDCITGFAGDVQTINIGKRSSNVSWCLYDKTGQIDRAKDGRNLPTYSATWKAHGWQGENVSRVELRLAQRGLTFHDDDGVELNLRNPAECTEANIRRAWAHATAKYRMVVPGTATRRERCSVDPRWSAVQSWVHVEPEHLVQYRQVAEDAHAEKVRRAAKAAARSLRQLAVLHGYEVSSADGLRELAMFADTLAAQQVALGEYQGDYAKLVDVAVGQQCQAARPVLVHAVGRIPRGLNPRDRTDTPGWWEKADDG